MLPYAFDPNATCPIFFKYLDEIFLGKQAQIDFLQEAVGYILQRSIPVHTLFLLVGNGSIGKSVLINTITSLFGEDNTSNINLTRLSDEYYVLDLFGKMLNVSSETPNRIATNTDRIKEVVSGDWVPGGILIKQRLNSDHLPSILLP